MRTEGKRVMAFWRKKTLSHFVLVFLSLELGLNPPVSADNLIVFSAQDYRWVPGYSEECDSARNGNKLIFGGQVRPRQLHLHLYLVPQNRTSRIKLTSGSSDDTNPSWSPNRTRITFLRHNQSGETNLCSVSLPSHRVTSLYQLGNDVSISYCWSPRGNLIAIVSKVNGSYNSPTISRIAVIDVSKNQGAKDETNRAKVVLKIKGVHEFAWSPDNRHLFMVYSDHRCEVYNFGDNQSKPTPSLSNPLWLNDHCILGIYYDLADLSLAHPHFDVLDLNSDRCRKYNLVEDRPQNEDYRENPLDSFVDNISWHRSPTSKEAFVMQVDWDMSDGEHSWCYTAKLGSLRGQAKSVGPCEFGGYSPNGTEFVVFGHEWVGRYKRGGARLGGLEVKSVSGKHIRWLTAKLIDIKGASWFEGLPAPTYPF